MLRDFVKRLVTSSATYGIGGVLQRLLGFVLVPIYTRYLTPADYGMMTLLLVTGTVVSTFLRTGMGSALFREVLLERTDPAVAESTALYYVAAQGALLAAVLVVLAPAIATLIFGSAAQTTLLRLVVVTVVLQLVEVLALARCRIRDQPVLYATLSILRFTVGAALIILFVVGLRRGVEGVIVASLLTAGLFAFVYLTLLRQALRPRISLSVLRRLVTFGGPLVPAGLASFVLTYGDRYFLQHYTTTAVVGVYSLGYSLGLVIQLAVQAVQLAWPTQMFPLARLGGGERLLARTVTYYVMAMGFAALAVSVLAREVLVILATPRFYDASLIVPFSATASVLYGLRFMTSTGTDVRNKTAYTVPIIIVAAAVNLLLNWVLIPRYGMIGAGVATVSSYALLLAISVPVNLRLWHIPYEYGRLAKIAGVCAVVYLAASAVPTHSLWRDGAIKVVVLGTYPVLLYAARVFDEREQRAARALVGTWRARFIAALGRL